MRKVQMIIEIDVDVVQTIIPARIAFANIINEIKYLKNLNAIVDELKQPKIEVEND